MENGKSAKAEKATPVLENVIKGANELFSQMANDFLQFSEFSSGAGPVDLEKTFTAWKTAFNIDDKEILNKFFEESKVDPYNIQKIVDTGWSGVTYLQKQLSDNALNMGESIKNLTIEEPDPNVVKAIEDIYKNQISKFFSIPQLGLARSYQEKMGQAIDKYNVLQTNMLEFLYFLYMPVYKSLKLLQENVAELAENGTLPEDEKVYYRIWITYLEEHYMNMFKSSEYIRAMGKALNAVGEFVSARKGLIQDMLQTSGIMVEKDMDALYKEIYFLKKRVKQLEKAK